MSKQRYNGQTVFRDCCVNEFERRASWKLFFIPYNRRRRREGVRPLHRPRSAILGRAITSESQGHHEMSPQTSYKQKKTTILPHFSRTESCYHSLRQITNIKASKFTFQTFKIRFSDLQNSRFKSLKFAFQTFKIRVSRFQNSRFKA